MAVVDNTNVYKYTDYKVPILYYKTDFRTSTRRAIRPCSLKERNFVGVKLRNLCDALSEASEQPPKGRFISEKMDNYIWKVLQYRNP